MQASQALIPDGPADPVPLDLVSRGDRLVAKRSAYLADGEIGLPQQLAHGFVDECRITLDRVGPLNLGSVPGDRSFGDLQNLGDLSEFRSGNCKVGPLQPHCCSRVLRKSGTLNRPATAAII